MTLYDEDYYAWTQEKAARLREIGRGGRPNAPVDWALVAEEVEDLGRSEKRTVRAQIVRIISHLLKLEHLPATNLRAGWQRIISDARIELDDALTPTLRRDAEQSLQRFWRYARRDAALGLAENGEAETAKALPNDLPYTLDQILDEDFLPANIHGIVDEVV